MKQIFTVVVNDILCCIARIRHRAMHRDANYGGHVLERNIDRPCPRTRKSRTINPRAALVTKYALLCNSESIMNLGTILSNVLICRMGYFF